MISFIDEAIIHQDFTNNPDFVMHSLRMLRMEGNNAHMLDAMHQALLMLEQRPPQRRRIILMIAERRDRSSQPAWCWRADVVDVGRLPQPAANGTVAAFRSTIAGALHREAEDR